MAGGLLRNVEAIGHGGFRHHGRGRPRCHGRGAALLRRWSPWGSFPAKGPQSRADCADTVRDATPRSPRAPRQLPALRRRRGGRAAQRGLATRARRPRGLRRQLQPAAARDPVAAPGPPGHAAPDLRRRIGPLHVVGGAPHAGGRRHGERARASCCSCRSWAWPSTASRGSRSSRRLRPARHPGRDVGQLARPPGHGAAPALPHRRHRRHAVRRHPRPSRPPRRVERAHGADAASRGGAQRRGTPAGPAVGAAADHGARRAARPGHRVAPRVGDPPGVVLPDRGRHGGHRRAVRHSSAPTIEATLAAAAAPRPARGGGHARAGGRPHRPRRRRADGAGGARRLGGHPRRLGPGLSRREAARRARHRQPRHVDPERMRRPVRRPGALPGARPLQLGRPPHARSSRRRWRSADASPASCTTDWPTSWPSSPARPAVP